MVLVVERLQECGGCGENSQLGRIRSSAVDYVIEFQLDNITEVGSGVR